MAGTSLAPPEPPEPLPPSDACPALPALPAPPTAALPELPKAALLEPPDDAPATEAGASVEGSPHAETWNVNANTKASAVRSGSMLPLLKEQVPRGQHHFAQRGEKRRPIRRRLGLLTPQANFALGGCGLQRACSNAIEDFSAGHVDYEPARATCLHGPGRFVRPLRYPRFARLRSGARWLV